MYLITNLVSFTTYFCRVPINPKCRFREDFAMSFLAGQASQSSQIVAMMPPKSYTEDNVANAIHYMQENNLGTNTATKSTAYLHLHSQVASSASMLRSKT